MGGGPASINLSPEEGKSSLEHRNPHVYSSSSSSSDASLSSAPQKSDYVRNSRHYKEIMQSYTTMQTRSESLNQAKNKILSYKPGAWIEKAGGMTKNDYAIPETTTLMLIGPRGSGKSSLLNRISSLFESDKFASDRAQVSYNFSVGDGTSFLQEYMIPRDSTSFCLYDTRSLTTNDWENLKFIKSWMKNGVRHGQFVERLSDDPNSTATKWNELWTNNCLFSKTRKVNFVIFVINGLSVLKSMDNVDGTQYTRMLTRAFNSPYVTFKDDKPVVAVTHGDELSLSERARVRMYLGELLGVPPTKQIFDIPDKCDPVTELAIMEMLCYSLEHADRNLPLEPKIGRMDFFILLLLCYLILGLFLERKLWRNMGFFILFFATLSSAFGEKWAFLFSLLPSEEKVRT